MASSSLSHSSSSSFILSLLAIITIASSSKPHLGKEQLTHLHFYLHDVIYGPGLNAVPVVKPAGNNSTFGEVYVIDDYVREGPDPASRLIGRAQGFTMQASMEETALLTVYNFVFTEDEYKGSTLALFGRAVFGGKDEVIERSIAGGSGKFRLARGYSLSKPISYSREGNLILQIDVYVMHY